MLKDSFKRDGMVMHMAGAAMLTSMENPPDADTLLENEKILKSHEGIFSPFRGALKLPIVINMAMSDDPEEYLVLVRKAYDMICARMGSRNESYYAAAMSVASMAGSENELESCVEKSMEMISENKTIDELLQELGMTREEIDAEVAEADAFLKTQRGFGGPIGGSGMRKAYAEILVCISKSRESNAAGIAAGEAISKAAESRFRAAMIMNLNMNH